MIKVLVDVVTRLVKCAGDVSYTIGFIFQGQSMVQVMKSDGTIFYIQNITNLAVEETEDLKPVDFKWDRYKLINGLFVKNDDYVENTFDYLIQSAANIGTSGTGVYESKSGNVLQFRKLNSINDALIITYDEANKKIDFDINSELLSISVGQGLEIVSNEINIKLDGNSLQLSEQGLKAKDFKKTFIIGGGSEFLLNHGLDTFDVVVQVFENSEPYENVYTTTKRVSKDECLVSFDCEIPIDSCKVVIIG